MKHIFPIFLFCLCISISLAAQNTYIHCGNLIDVENKKVLEEQTIVVKDNKILDVQQGYASIPSGAKAIDLKQMTVMPGFMDMHVHIEHQSNPKTYEDRFREDKADVALKATVFCTRTLEAGFTTVRDLGGTGVNVSLRDAINKGYIKGPRIYTAEKSLATTGGHADPTNGVKEELKGNPGPKDGVINSVEDAYKAVRQRYKNGADCIKITATGGVLSVAKDGMGPQFTLEEVQAVVAAAKDYGMTTAAHAHGVEGMKRAIIGGITSIEHGTLMDDETMALMKKHGTFLVPTISAGKYVVEKAKIPGYFPAIIVPKALEVGPQIQATFGRAYKSGVKIAFGTDSGVSPHGKNAQEFGFMVEAGMPEIEAICAATINAAELLNITETLGSIASGKLADIIAVKGDPLKDISVLEHIDFVMKNGIVEKGE